MSSQRKAYKRTRKGHEKEMEGERLASLEDVLTCTIPQCTICNYEWFQSDESIPTEILFLPCSCQTTILSANNGGRHRQGCKVILETIQNQLQQNTKNKTTSTSSIPSNNNFLPWAANALQNQLTKMKIQVHKMKGNSMCKNCLQQYIIHSSQSTGNHVGCGICKTYFRSHRALARLVEDGDGVVTMEQSVWRNRLNDTWWILGYLRKIKIRLLYQQRKMRNDHESKSLLGCGDDEEEEEEEKPNAATQSIQKWLDMTDDPTDEYPSSTNDNDNDDDDTEEQMMLQYLKENPINNNRKIGRVELEKGELKMYLREKDPHFDREARDREFLLSDKAQQELGLDVDVGKQQEVFDTLKKSKSSAKSDVTGDEMKLYTIFRKDQKYKQEEKDREYLYSGEAQREFGQDLKRQKEILKDIESKCAVITDVDRSGSGDEDTPILVENVDHTRHGFGGDLKRHARQQKSTERIKSNRYMAAQNNISISHSEWSFGSHDDPISVDGMFDITKSRKDISNIEVDDDDIILASDNTGGRNNNAPTRNSTSRKRTIDTYLERADTNDVVLVDSNIEDTQLTILQNIVKDMGMEAILGSDACENALRDANGDTNIAMTMLLSAADDRKSRQT